MSLLALLTGSGKFGLWPMERIEEKQGRGWCSDGELSRAKDSWLWQLQQFLRYSFIVLRFMKYFSWKSLSQLLSNKSKHVKWLFSKDRRTMRDGWWLVAERIWIWPQYDLAIEWREREQRTAMSEIKDWGRKNLLIYLSLFFFFFNESVCSDNLVWDPGPLM